MTIRVIGGTFGDCTLDFGRYRFVCGGDCRSYDWLVVFDELPVDRLALSCPREQTILCTWEPVSIKSYSRAYTRQFGHLLTNRPPEAERHPGYHLGRGYFPCFVRVPGDSVGAIVKRKPISAVCSAKQMRHTAHSARFRLVEELARAVPGLEWFGKGVRPLERKEDALLDYRYHVAVENHIGVHHWTEKFSDAILCECLPFYAGDPALAEIFPRESFIPIPIDDPSAAVRIVTAAIANDEYSKRRAAVLEAKRLILTKYNFWQQVIDVVESRDSSIAVSAPARRAGTVPFIYARRVLRWRSPSALAEDGWRHLRRLIGGEGR